MAAEPGSSSAAKERAESGISEFGKAVVGGLFARRHEDPLMRGMARTSIRDARLLRDWRRARGR